MEIYNNIEELEEVISKKYRNWIFLLYEDTISYNFNEVLRTLKSYKNWAYIEHKPEEGEKKVHYHFILRLDNATKKDTLHNKLGIPLNHMNNVNSMRSMCRYLIHLDDEDKIQYNLDDVEVSKCFKKTFLKSFDDRMDETDILNAIFQFIEVECSGNDYFSSMKNLLVYVNSNVYDTIYKRYRYEINDYLKSVCI